MTKQAKKYSGITHIKNALFFILLLAPIISHAQNIKILVTAIHGIETAKFEWQPTIDHLQNALPEHTFSLVPVILGDLKKAKYLISTNEIDYVIT